jgi:Zinc-uptake complex component A periplasmic
MVGVEPGLWLFRSVGHGDQVSRAGCECRPHLPSRAPYCRLGEELAEDHVGQASFQAAQGAFLAFAGGELLGVVGLAAGVVAFVGHRGDVQGGVQSPVPGPGQAVAGDLSAGDFQGCGAVQKVVDQIVADYTKIAPGDAAFFASQKASFETSATAEYKAVIAQIRTRYAGTKVGASESIFAMLAPALGLDLITPPGFLKAISEGTDPTAADKITIDTRIRNRQISVYVYNSQNATPDVQAQIALARAQRIPVTTITETLVPPTASWQAWQTAQLVALKAALAQATAR